MANVYLSLGSNMDDPVSSVREAIDRLRSEDGFAVVGIGCFYQTEPQGKTDQPWFVNTAVAVKVDCTPEEALEKVKNIERKMGRVTGKKWGPRKIDIDIIFYDDLVMNTDELTIPHPLAAERRFVLQPLVDINPGLVHPGLGVGISELLGNIPDRGQRMSKLNP